MRLTADTVSQSEGKREDGFMVGPSCLAGSIEVTNIKLGMEALRTVHTIEGSDPKCYHVNHITAEQEGNRTNASPTYRFVGTTCFFFVPRAICRWQVTATTLMLSDLCMYLPHTADYFQRFRFRYRKLVRNGICALRHDPPPQELLLAQAARNLVSARNLVERH